MSAKFAISTALREVRFHLSQTGEASAALHKFLASNYETLKSATNYKIPILIRESSGIAPSITVRFEKGREVSAKLKGMDTSAITAAVSSLLK